jgi:hypothetical protein
VESRRYSRSSLPMIYLRLVYLWTQS